MAYDSYGRVSGQEYPLSGPGIYVIGLQVDGRNGKFLSQAELKLLKERLERYCRGYGAILNRAPANHPDVEFVVKVDSRLESPPPGRPSQFIEHQSDLNRVRCLIDGLDRRCDAQLDPTGAVHQIQSPLYVGCSNKLETRSKDYQKPTIP